MLVAPSAAHRARGISGRRRSCLPFKLLLFCLVRPGDCAEAGASLLFDGANDFATAFPGFAILSAWTLEAWVLPTQLLSERCILCMRTFGQSHLLTIKSSSSRAWSVLFGVEEFEIPASEWLGGGNESDSLSGGQHHLALTHQVLGSASSRLSLYLNSTLRASWEVSTSLTASITAVDPALPTLLGACYRSGRGSREGEGHVIFRTAFFAGHMDEVRWWGRALDSSEIAETWQLSGDADMWTVAGVGYRASSPRKDDLQAQYSFDVLGAQIHDGSGKGKDGLLGTKGDEVDAPRSLESAFGGTLSLGSIYFRLREDDHFTLNFESFMHSAAMRSILAAKFGIPFAGVPTTGMFQGLHIVRGLRQPSLGTALHVTGDSGSPLSAASLVTGMTLDITTGAAVEHDDFALQACLEAGNASSCEEFVVYDVTIVVEGSQVPVAGPAHALELSRRGGAVLLPRVPQDVTFEFWMQLLPPTAMGATILAIYAQSGADSLWEVVRLWLDTDTTETVLDVCSNSSSEPTRFRVSGGLMSEAPQHLAVSFRRDAGSNYEVLVHSDCVQLLAATVSDPCYWLDSTDLWRPTLGQRYMHEVRILPWPLSDSFAPMRLAEVRVWDHERSASELCAARNERLAGNETGLIAYSPVVAADATTAAAGVRRLTLTSALDTGVHPAGAALPDVDSSIEVLCTDEFDVCPYLAKGVGFSFRPSPFDLPSEVVTLQTTGMDAMTITLIGDDLDNYIKYLPESLGLDTWRFDILEPPDEECVFTFENGVTRYNERMTATSSCTSCGTLPTRVIPPSLEPLAFSSTCSTSGCREAPRTVLPPSSMPLRFEPSVPFPCTTEMKYRTVDAHGRVSGRTATVRLEVLTARLTIVSVVASDSRANSGGLRGGVVLNFTFSDATTAPPVNVHQLFEVINGSWGQDSPINMWLNGNRSLLVLLGDNAEDLGTDMTIGLTRFQVLESANLRKQDDAFSAPSHDVSPQLAGNFTAHICNPGEVYNFATGGLCDDCVPGTYWAVVEAKPTCLACPSGQFNDQAAQTACSPCTPGTYLPDDSVNRTACLLAPPGFFVEGYEEAVAEPCMDGALTEQAGHSQCYVCPTEADCLVPGYERRLPFAKPDFFRMDNGSFARCTVEAACIGSGACAEGHQDASLGCYPCSKGWSRGVGALHGTSSCWKCPSLLMILLRIFAVLVGSSLLVLYLAAINITAAHRLACLHPFVLKIGLGHLLLMNTLTNFAEWELRPNFGKATSLIHGLVAVLLGWDGMVPLSVIPVECLLEHIGGDGLARTWAALGLWLLFPGLLLLCCLAPPLIALRILRWRRRKRSSAVAAARSKAKVARRGQESGKVADDPHGREDVDAKLASIVPTAVNLPDDDDEDIIYDPTIVPVGWEAHYSDKHHKYYYYNSDREFSTWSHPVVQMAATSSRTRTAPPDASGTTSRGSNPKAFASAKEIDNVALEARFCGIWRKHLVALPAHGWYQAFLADSEGVIIVAALLLYPAVLRQVLVPLRCDVLSGVAGKPRLLVAPELACGASEHRAIAGVAWLVIVLWGLGFPALFVLIAWRSRRTLHNFWTSVRIGVLVAEYETKFFFWESVILLRRFAVLGVVVLAPPTRPVFRLILLLAIGVASTIMHSHNEPFDNRSGTLLDQLEERGLLIFCATTAAFILGFSQLMHPAINTVILLTTLAMHVLFLLQLLTTFLRFIRRSMADGVVEEHMKQEGESTSYCDFPFCCFKRCCRRLHERMFMQETDSQREKALIFYDTQEGNIMLQPSSTGKEPGDEEQHFLVTGLADCIAHAVTDLRIELLSMHFLEYLGRQAFAEHHRRSQVWGEVYRKLARRYKLQIAAEKQEAPSSPTTSQKSGGDDADKRKTLHFSEQTFSRGMPASDFQGYLNSISQYPWDHLLQTFHHFMVAKDSRFIDYTLAPRDRMIRKLFAHQTQAPGRLRRLDEKDTNALEDTGTTALEGGSPPRSFLADTEGSEKAKKDAEPVLEFGHDSGEESEEPERPLSAKASSLADNLFSHLRRESHMLTPPASAGSTAAGSAADNTGFGTRAGTASERDAGLTATISLNASELLGEQRPQEDIPGAMPSDGQAEEALSTYDSEISWVPMPFTDVETAAPLHHFWRRDNEPWHRNAAVVGL